MNTNLLKLCGFKSCIGTLQVIYLELEINFLGSTCSKDRENYFFCLAEVVTMSDILSTCGQVHIDSFFNGLAVFHEEDHYLHFFLLLSVTGGFRVGSSEMKRVVVF